MNREALIIGLIYVINGYNFTFLGIRAPCEDFCGLSGNRTAHRGRSIASRWMHWYLAREKHVMAGGLMEKRAGQKGFK